MEPKDFSSRLRILEQGRFISMLTIYGNSEDTPKDMWLELNNDSWFINQFVLSEARIDDKVMELMLKIDNATVTHPYIMNTPFGEGISMQYLSTGCKTAINIHTFTKKCFSAIECGSNAIIEILRLDRGNTILPFIPVIEDDFGVDIRLISNGTERFFKSANEFSQAWKGRV